MLIKSLKLKNIRSYLFQEIKFNKGITLLAGDIGAGKTTILLSLEFALFGISKTELPGKSLLRHGEKQGYVELSCEIGNKDILIRRTLERTPKSVVQSTGYIVIDNHKKEMTSEELKATIFQLLGYPKQLLKKNKNFLYRFTVYTPQEEMKNIIYENDENRMNTLRRIFQIDRYKTIRENSMVLMRNLRQKSKFLKQEINEFHSLEEEINELQKEKGILISQINKKKDIVEKTKSEKQELKKTQEEKEKEFLKFQENNNKIEQEINFIQKQKERISNEIKNNIKEEKEIMEKVKKIQIFKSEFEETKIVREIKKINEIISSIERDQSRLKEQLNNFLERKTSLTKEISELKIKTSSITSIKKKIYNNEKKISDLKRSCSKINNIRSVHENLITKRKELQIRLSQIKNDMLKLDNDICPLCKQKMAEEHRKHLLKENRDEISKIEMGIDKTSKLILDNENEINTIENQIETLNNIEKSISEDKTKLQLLNDITSNLEQKNKELRAVDVKILSTQSEIKKIKDKKEFQMKLEELNTQLSELQLNLEKKKQKAFLKERFEQLKKANSQLKEEYKTFEGRIEKLNKEKFNDLEKEKEKLNELENGFKKADENERKLSEEFITMKTNLSNYNSNLEKLEKKLKLRDIKKNEMTFCLNLMEWFDKYFIPLTEDIEKTVMLTVYSEFNDFFVQWFQMLINDENLQTKLNENFSPILIQNGYETSVNNLSGGEKTSLALAYRLALNKVINNLMTKIKTSDLIILDEPTDGFSSEQLDNVRQVLTELDINQIILVSHESKIESFAENIIYVKKLAGSSSL